MSALVLMVGCAPSLDISSQTGRRAIIELTQKKLTENDCVGAVATIEPLYLSRFSDNEVRTAAAAAYGCYAKVNSFTLISNLADSSAALATRELWQKLTQWFPSSTNDRVAEGGEFALNALFSILYPGLVIPSVYRVNWSSNNPGSLYAPDRTVDANLFLTFVSMAIIGAHNNRYGNPDATTFRKGNILPGNTALTTTAASCLYASAIVNMADGLGATVPYLSGSLSTSLKTITDTFSSAIYNACDVGCRNISPGGAWVASGCTVTTACASCPETLRNPDACLSVVSDQTSCAAAGVINFINESNFGWEGP